MTSDQPESRPARRSPAVVVVSLAVVIVAALAFWWYRPANIDNRYSKMDLVSLQRILDSNPNDAHAAKQIALRLANDGDIKLAEPALIKALDLNKSDAALGSALAQILMSTDRYPLAYQLLKTTLTAHPSDVTALQVLARLYINKASYHHAVEELEKVVASPAGSGLPDPWYQLAGCNLQMQKSAEADRCINKALAIKPDDPHYLSLKSRIDVASGRVDDAIAASTKAAQKAPQDVRMQANLADMLLNLHRNESDLALADQTIGKLEQIDQEYIALPFLRGKLEILRQHWEPAMHFLEKATISNPLQDETYFLLAQSYRRLGRTEDADRTARYFANRQAIRHKISDIASALEIHGQDLKLITQMADLQMQLRDTDAAIATMNAGLKIDPKNPVLNSWLSELKSRQSPAK